MPNQKRYIQPFLLMLLVLVVVFFVNISLGSASISLKSIAQAIFDTSGNERWDFIITQMRLPKAITAVLVGSGLAIAGLLMQTLFRNPLAGPFVLGISSGASLGVAILIFGAHLFGVGLATNASTAIASALGSFAVMALILLVAQKIKNTMSILIVGLMFASFSSAIISVLAYFGTAEQLQQFTFWGFGSLNNIHWNKVIILAVCYFLSLILVIRSLKPLNSLLLGEQYAVSLGVNIKQTRLFLLVATSVLTGIITAFVGPIAFIGLAIPHITKMVFTTSNHTILVPAVAVVGAIIMLICDSIAQVPFSENLLPINAITSLLGAPIVVWLIVRKRKNIS